LSGTAAPIPAAAARNPSHRIAQVAHRFGIRDEPLLEIDRY